MPPCLTQYYKVQINGKWINLGKGVMPSLNFSVVAIEKGAFEFPLNNGQPTYIHTHTPLRVDWLVWLYGISTTMGYLMPNPVHIY